MSEHDRWSAHLEYLKLAIALSTGVLSAAAAIYVDSDKIPGDNTKYFLLACVAAFFLALFFSILGVASVGNLLIHAAPAGGGGGGGAAAGNRQRKVTINAGLSFFFLCLAGLALAGFFAWKTFAEGKTGLERALSVSEAFVKQQISQQSETAALIELQAMATDKYSLKYRITPGTSTLELVFDLKANGVDSFKRVP